jgi:hypothetical protein
MEKHVSPVVNMWVLLCELVESLGHVTVIHRGYNRQYSMLHVVRHHSQICNIDKDALEGGMFTLDSWVSSLDELCQSLEVIPVVVNGTQSWPHIPNISTHSEQSFDYVVR